jgi:enediyne polyketide synthase
MDGRGDRVDRGDRFDRGGPVAIIGMACRFPGARDPAELHDLDVAGHRRFQPAGGLPSRPLHAALLDDRTVLTVSFGDPELEPHDLGPVQKLATETTALALTDAGLLDAAATTRTGLIIASAAPGVSELVRAEFGLAADLPYPRAAYQSSLHAVAAAADALQAGELDLAVAGGAELGIDPVWLALQARAGMLGTDEMRVYAADPAGLLPGEGCGIVVLARSADARAAGVPVYAEIAGWSAPPILAPARAVQAMRLAYQRAGIDPGDIQLIEGQGTGTAASDLAELAALAQLRRGGKAVAALGAVSASIGYTKAAAGVASLVKTAVAMAAGTIPPGTGCARPHPLIASGDALLRMPAQPEPWPDGTRLAAVNSLGTADPAVAHGRPGPQAAEGIHLVLRREGGTDGSGRRRLAVRRPATPPTAPAPASAPVPASVPAPGPVPEAPGRRTAPTRAGQPPQAATMSARGTAQPRADTLGHGSIVALCGGNLGALAERLDDIAASAATLSDGELTELARQLALGALRAAARTAPLRVALAAATPSRLADQAQYAAWLLRMGGATSPMTAPGVHVSAGATGTVVMLFPGRAESAAAYPALLAVSLETLGTLDLLGVRPATGVGYSLGEITGLVWAGSLPAAEAARLVAQYGQVLGACARGPAAMARIVADADMARALCAPDHLDIAAYEGPRGHVLAGSVAGIRELTRRAGPLGVPVEILAGPGAMHSPAMAGCVAPIRRVLAGTRIVPPQRRLFSTVTGDLITAGDDIAELLARQVSLPVLFAQAMTQAAGEADLIVTAGPDADLAATAAGCCGVPAVTVPVPTRAGLTGAGLTGAGLTGAGRTGADSATAAQLIAALFAAGAITDLRPFLAPSGPAETLASRTVPRMRVGEPAAGQAPQGPGGQKQNGGPVRRTTARSG